MMLPKDKHAVIYGGAGSIGGAVARAVAAEGATVHLVGRTHANRSTTSPAKIVANGGIADTAVVDALDRAWVEAHADAVVERVMLGRPPTLTELGDAATFLASDRASAMTAILANVTCGAFLD
jgi:NAD(P)-dependent dehydrogenase (short-subunit alcohol dehydrogenase family)